MNNMNVAPARAGTVRVAVLLGLFAGTAAGAGFLLAGIPNLELMSLVVALAGVALGARLGAVCGAMAAGIYSLGSPYGVPAIWILAAQMVGLAGIGALAGAWMVGGKQRKAMRGGFSGVPAALALGLLGTTWYELVTNTGVLMGFDLEPSVVLVGALPFFLVHLGTNLVIFGALFPPLARRFGHLGKEPLVGRAGSGTAILLLAIMGLAAPGVHAQTRAAEDSVQVGGENKPVAVDTGLVNGWQRGLWQPFSQSLLDLLAWHGDFVPVVDGGLGATARILGEYSTSPRPLLMRAGIPLGTGHVLADDPGLVPLAGMTPDSLAFGLDPWGGSGGWIDLARRDREPGDAFTSYQGAKGRHETYMRSLQLLTPQAPWRLGFEYQENLDKEGYNFTDLPGEVFDPVPDDEDFPGHARLRQSHVRLSRNLDAGSRLDVDYDYGRKTKDLVPALVADHQEIWADGISVDMHGGSGRLGVRTAVFWRNRDVRFRDNTTSTDTFSRLVATGREGFLFEVTLGREVAVPPAAYMTVPDSTAALDSVPAGQADSPVTTDSLAVVPPDTAGVDTGPADATPVPTSPDTTLVAGGAMGLLPVRLSLSLANWTLDDTGPDTTGLAALYGPVHLDGQEAVTRVAAGYRLGPVTARAHGGGLWTDRLGWDLALGAVVEKSAGRLRWRLFGESGGRAPRSDELGTVVLHGVADRVLILEPNADLKREKTSRWGVRVASSLVGIDLAVEGAAGRVEDGITWVASSPGSDTGRLVNGSELDYQRLTASAAHQGRFLGWGRIRYEGTWQKFTPGGLPAAFLPPESYNRLTVMWENHLFQEDGILELALFRTYVDAMSDPWDVTRSYMIPARTLTDLVVGFRLVGADLSLAFRNLTGERYRATANAWGPGRETVMRLSWNFTR